MVLRLNPRLVGQVFRPMVELRLTTLLGLNPRLVGQVFRLTMGARQKDEFKS